MRVVAALVLTTVVTLGTAVVARAQRPEPVGRMLKGAMIYKVLDHDAIPAIDKPTFVTAAAADSFMAPDELVLGVTDGTNAKCYSTWLLEGHEIVNDWLGEVPIAAEW